MRQTAHLTLIGLDHRRGRDRGGFVQRGVALRDQRGAGVALLLQEGPKRFQTQGLRGRGRGIGHQKLERDLGRQVTEPVHRLGKDAEQDGPQLVGLALNGAAQQFDEPHLRGQPLGQRGIGLQPPMLIAIRPQDAGE